MFNLNAVIPWCEVPSFGGPKHGNIHLSYRLLRHGIHILTRRTRLCVVLLGSIKASNEEILDGISKV